MRQSKRYGIGMAILIVMGIAIGIAILGTWQMNTPDTTPATSANSISPDVERQPAAQPADETQSE